VGLRGRGAEERARALRHADASRLRADLTDEEALAAFVRRIEAISMAEVSEWRSELTRAPASEG
jgi:hypothetical protein